MKKRCANCPQIGSYSRECSKYGICRFTGEYKNADGHIFRIRLLPSGKYAILEIIGKDAHVSSYSRTIKDYDTLMMKLNILAEMEGWERNYES